MMVVIGLFFGCVAAEIALRIVGYSYPIWYQTDPVRGYAPIPNLEGWFWVENTNYVKINSEGFRDREHTKAKPANTLRIAVIGDSFAEARQVPAESAFWTVIERELQKSEPRGRNIEVLNFGVGGYGTVEELLTLRERVWEYSPDVVLLAFCTYNDVTDNYRPFKKADELPYYKLEADRLVLDDSFLQSKKYLRTDSAWFKAWVALHNHSRLIQVLHHAQFAIRTRISEWKEQRRLTEVQKQQEASPLTGTAPTTASLTDLVGLPNMIYREPDDADWENAWRVTEALVKEIHEETQKHSARLILATITADIQVYPDPGVRQRLMQRVGVNDLFYPDTRLKLFAGREGISFVDLAGPMQQAADRDKVFFHGFGKEIGNGHWNEAGHKFAGEIIAKEIAEILPN